jgi:type IV secretion system protein VirD4
MYRILRRILIASVLLAAYVAALFIYLVPYAWLVAVVIGFVMLFRKTNSFTAFGTARFANLDDLEGMIDE